MNVSPRLARVTQTLHSISRRLASGLLSLDAGVNNWTLSCCIISASLAVACSGQYGQRPPSGEWITIRSGDSLSKIAEEHQVPLQDIIEINGIRDPNRILVGQSVFVPQFARDLSASHVSQLGDEPSVVTDDTSHVVALSERPGFKAIRGASPQSFSKLAWPLKLSLASRIALSSGYGMRGGKLHRGLDVRAPSGTPVRAALGGAVTRSEMSSGGYGRVIYLRHTGGVETRYAHHQKNLVKVGQIVRAGDVIAEVGSSGRSTNPHLHFEIRIRGEAIDPLLVLPALSAE